MLPGEDEAELPSNPVPTGLREKVTRGGAWMFAKQGYVSLANLGGVVLLAHLVSPREFGQVALAATFVSVLALVTDLGLTPSLIRLQNPSRLQVDTAFWTSLLTSTALGGILVGSSVPLAHWLGQPGLWAVLAVLSIEIPVSSLRVVPVSTLTVQMRFKPLALREMGATTLATAGAIPLALAGFGVWALVFQAVGGVVIDVAILWAAVSWRPSRAFSWHESRALLAFGLPALLTQLVKNFRDNGIQLIVGRVLGPTALGVFVVATRIASAVLSLFAQVVNAVALPAFSSVKTDPERLQQMYRRALRVCAALAVPALAWISASAPHLIPVVFGSRWESAVTVAEMTALTSAVLALSWLDGNVWWAIGRPRVELSLTLLITGADVVLVIVLAPHGIVPVAVGLLVRALISVPLRACVLVLVGRFTPRVFVELPRAAVCTAAMYAAVVGLVHVLGAGDASLLAVLADASAGLVVYLLFSLIFQRTFVREMVRDVKALVRNRRGHVAATG